MKKFLFLILLVMTGGCSYRNPLSDMAFQMTPADPYVIANWYKIEAVGDPVKIYIEGDGNAFDEKGYPTDNPTPHDTTVRDLAAGDPSPNVVYLARPCQYVQNGCDIRDWTDNRYSETVIHSMDRVIAAVMKKARTNKAVLIGYAGGSQIADLVAARHPERIHKLITVGGIPDPRVWAEYHGYLPSGNALNIQNYRSEMKQIPQIHYVGDRDKDSAIRMLRDLVGAEAVVVVKGAGNGKGFESIHRDIYGVK